MRTLNQHETDLRVSNMASSREGTFIQFIATKIEERVLAVGQTLGKKTKHSIEWNAKVIAKAIRHENSAIFLVNPESLTDVITDFIDSLDIKKCS